VDVLEHHQQRMGSSHRAQAVVYGLGKPSGAGDPDSDSRSVDGGKEEVKRRMPGSCFSHLIRCLRPEQRKNLRERKIGDANPRLAGTVAHDDLDPRLLGSGL
jgi:hypothetical protein